MTIRQLYKNKPTRWCSGASAKNIRGFSVNVNSSSATSWCLHGAILKCYPDPPNSTPHDKRHKAIMNKLLAEIESRYGQQPKYSKGINPISIWNDDPARTFDDISKIIESAEV